MQCRSQSQTLYAWAGSGRPSIVMFCCCYLFVYLSIYVLIYYFIYLCFHLQTQCWSQSQTLYAWAGLGRPSIGMFFYSVFIYFLVYLCFDLFISFIYVSICRHNVGPSLRLCMHGLGWAGHPLVCFFILYLFIFLFICVLIYLFPLFMFPFADTMSVPVSDFVCMG